MLFTIFCKVTGSKLYGVASAATGVVICYLLAGSVEDTPVLLGALGGFVAGKSLGYIIEGWVGDHPLVKPYVLGGIIVGVLAALYLGRADLPGLGETAAERLAGGLFVWGGATFVVGFGIVGKWFSIQVESLVSVRLRQKEEMDKRLKRGD